MTRKGKRLTLIAGAMAVLGLAAGLMLFALRDNIVFFYTPSELAKKQVASGARLRIGGLVKEGSVVKNGHDVNFTITDKTRDLAVSYTGLLPDLVLAKHDERYMPRDVADALKKQGVWQGETK
jgi:cytochrome c-type biogenesis protein CcmE